MRRPAAVVLMAGILLVLGGCEGPADQETIVRIAYRQAPVTLDPYAHDDFVTRAVLGGVYEPLVRIGSRLEVEPCLARRWENPDDLTWRLRIRRNVHFHDGSTLTPEDVVRSLRYAMTAPDSRIATYLAGIETVRLLPDDPYTVEIVSREPQPLLLTRLALVPIVPGRVRRRPEPPIGTGPYRWIDGTREGPIHLARWEAYWGERPMADTVIVEIAPDERRLVELIRSGRVDAVAEISGSLVPEDGFGPRWRLVRFPAAVTAILGCNVLQRPLDDVRVRTAIDLAIDRQALIREGGLRAAEPASGLVPQGVVGALPAVTPPAADPERARELLESAGYGDGLDLTLEFSGAQPGIVEALGEALGRVGIRITAVERPWGELYRRTVAGRCQLVLFGWAFPFGDASDLLDSLVHSRDPEQRLGLGNGTGYHDSWVDEQIEAADRETRGAVRQELIHRVLRKVAEDRPLIPLYHRSRLGLARRPFDLRPYGTGWVCPQCLVISEASRDGS